MWLSRLLERTIAGPGDRMILGVRTVGLWRVLLLRLNLGLWLIRALRLRLVISVGRMLIKFVCVG